MQPNLREPQRARALLGNDGQQKRGSAVGGQKHAVELRTVLGLLSEMDGAAIGTEVNPLRRSAQRPRRTKLRRLIGAGCTGHRGNGSCCVNFAHQRVGLAVVNQAKHVVFMGAEAANFFSVGKSGLYPICLPIAQTHDPLTVVITGR